MFDELVVSSVVPTRTSERWTVAFSAIGQSMLLGVLILVPLIYTEALPDALLRTIIVAPPPPAPPPLPPTRAATPVRLISFSQITTPAAILRRISTETNEPPTVYVEGSATGGADSAVLRDLLHSAMPIEPPKPDERRPQRIRQGGVVQSALLVNRVVPAYPAVAITAHISGTVVLHAIIAKDGTVQELSYVSGPPLLMKAAMDAVRQWRYRPTMLNDEPVEVETTIDVVFNLGG